MKTARKAAHRMHADLIRRAWTRAERRVVLRGLFGRLLVAIEPIICCTVFAGLAIALIFVSLPADATSAHPHETGRIVAPIFGLASIAFFAYAALLLVAPARALVATFSPIFIVDGYLRYRKPDARTEANSNGYVAVLTDDRRLVAEWPSIGEHAIAESIRPALIEFSFFGGIHRIDGRSTGVIPASLPPMGVGQNAPRV